MKRKILVTSALPYANGPIHLGHLAGAYLPADIFVRYHRLLGSDVIYICGSDEHGVPIMLRARAEGTSPQSIVNHYHEINKNSFAAFGMSFDYYGRTSSPVHHQTSQDFFRVLAEKEVFILKTEKQLYDPEAKMFLADRFVIGTCPSCGYDQAYGDQCEKCGKSLSPTELKNPRSAVTNARPVLKETTHWYLPLGKLQPKLEEWIATHPEWKPNVLGQVKSWLNEGLGDRAVTRDLPWGVPVPEDVARKYAVDASGKVLYVWFDAPIGYISATKEWAQARGDENLWKEYWQNPETRLVHFIGKDNIVFHCLIFPAMLMAHGDFVLPENVPANEFLNLEGNKLSTSRNYAVWLNEYLEKFEADALRYVLASIMPENRDSDFSWREYQARYNNELADIFGNFVNRTLVFAHKYFGGKIPKPGVPEEADKKLMAALLAAPKELGNLIDQYQFRTYVQKWMDLARLANKYFNDQKPWYTRKTDMQKCATTINLCVQTVATLSVLGEPLLPFTARKIWQMLRIGEKHSWDEYPKNLLHEGHLLGKPQILFEKIDDEVVKAESEKLQKALPKEDQRVKPQIDYETFSKIELRVAEITAVESIPGAEKLLKLQVNLGKEKRQIVAGIAHQYEPDELIGKKIIIVANLKPVRLFGVESQGMLLAASSDDRLSLLSVLDDSIPVGSEIK